MVAKKNPLLNYRRTLKDRPPAAKGKFYFLAEPVVLLRLKPTCGTTSKMNTRSLSACAALIGVFLTPGCSTAPPVDEALGAVDSLVVQAPMDEAWQAVKGVLRNQEYLIYTRDLRGLFVAYTDIKRKGLTRYRQQITVTLREQTRDSTEVTVEMVQQTYGVSLLTYPGWHDLKTEDHSTGELILAALTEKLSDSEDETAD